jgi:hypothetical protein
VDTLSLGIGPAKGPVYGDNDSSDLGSRLVEHGHLGRVVASLKKERGQNASSQNRRASVG